MSVQNLPPSHDAAAEPEELTIRRLVRALDFAEGFWLGFVKSNNRAQRRRVAALCKSLLEPLNVRLIEIELDEPITDILPILKERLTQEQGKPISRDSHSEAAHATTDRPKLAIFVYGLEHSIPSKEAHPPILSSLNLKRELFRQQLPYPLVIWLPDYALTALARQAPDFWAWRSGLYDFAPERELADQSLAEVYGEALHVTISLSERSKHERLTMLKGLLDDYRQLGNSPREQFAQLDILHDMGLIHTWLGEFPEAKRAYEESLAISRELNHERAMSATLHDLGIVAHETGDYADAERLYDKSLEIKRRLGDQRGIAISLHQLGRLAQDQGDYAEAQRLYSEGLEIQRQLGNQRGIADTVHELGNIAYLQGDFNEARRLYDQSVEIVQEFGDQSGIGIRLHQLAMLEQSQGDISEARRLYEQSLGIVKKLGDQKHVAGTLHQLGRLAEEEGNKVEAKRLFYEALSILERLGSPDAEIARKSLARVED